MTAKPREWIMLWLLLVAAIIGGLIAVDGTLHAEHSVLGICQLIICSGLFTLRLYRLTK